ncbi:ubiquitin-protein ligase e3 [Gigaspora margarita]|uniref:Ubiquitin-protein ligase e3 n=1 Tax=Gigaspora margarita TaxID=4874 RepID=A0A8H3XE66_GIGMA|nr:ubiquitin-protein ligase e3 [Gigaspora margarita]
MAKSGSKRLRTRSITQEEVSLCTPQTSTPTTELTLLETPDTNAHKRKRQKSRQSQSTPIPDGENQQVQNEMSNEQNVSPSTSNKENDPDHDQPTSIKAAEEILRLKKEVERLTAEIAFKDQVIASLQADNKRFKPGLTCVICVEYMSNPCTISCGHTFCYQCLYDWVKIRKECPTCRVKITSKPALSFVVKEQVETFVDRLSSDDEKRNAQERLRKKEQEMKSIADPWRGLFNEPNAPVIIDLADGIRRCTRCSWEVVGDHCVNCGQQFIIEIEDDIDIPLDEDADTDDYDDSFIDDREIVELVSSDDTYTGESESELTNATSISPINTRSRRRHQQQSINEGTPSRPIVISEVSTNDSITPIRRLRRLSLNQREVTQILSVRSTSEDDSSSPLSIRISRNRLRTRRPPTRFPSDDETDGSHDPSQ